MSTDQVIEISALLTECQVGAKAVHAGIEACVARPDVECLAVLLAMSSALCDCLETLSAAIVDHPS